MFLDTSGLFAYSHVREPNHIKSRELIESSSTMVTHSLVLVEFVPLATTRGLPRKNLLGFLTDLIQHPAVEIVWVERADVFDALDFLGKRLDKSYSLCDMVSFQLMRQRGMREALTTDQHFEQEGFTALLR